MMVIVNGEGEVNPRKAQVSRLKGASIFEGKVVSGKKERFI